MFIQYDTQIVEILSNQVYMPASITNFNIYIYIETLIFSHKVKQINTIFTIMKYHINTLYIVVSNKLS